MGGGCPVGRGGAACEVIVVSRYGFLFGAPVRRRRLGPLATSPYHALCPAPGTVCHPQRAVSCAATYAPPRLLTHDPVLTRNTPTPSPTSLALHPSQHTCLPGC